MRLLADTSASSPEETLHLTNHWHHRSPPDQTRLGSRHQIEYINPVEDGLELLPRGYRAPHEPCEHARDDRPTSSFSVLMDWMFVDFLDGSSSLDSWLAMDSSSSDSSSSSDESFDAASSSQESSSSSSEDSTRHHHYTHGRNQGHGHDHDHGHTIPYDGISAHEINYDKLNKPRPMFLDHSNQRSHHIRSRNSLPDKYEESGWFEDLELDEGCDYVEGALTVFFFVGAFTLLFFPFFLLARALKRMVRNARESHYNGASAVLPSMPPRPASSGFGDCAERRRGTAAAAAYGYQALPDVEDSAATDDDAIVVTGMPVNPPPSVTN